MFTEGRRTFITKRQRTVPKCGNKLFKSPVAYTKVPKVFEVKIKMVGNFPPFNRPEINYETWLVN